jgi:hypothetical protein
MCFEMGPPPLWQEQGSDYYWSLPLYSLTDACHLTVTLLYLPSIRCSESCPPSLRHNTLMTSHIWNRKHNFTSPACIFHGHIQCAYVVSLFYIMQRWYAFSPWSHYKARKREQPFPVGNPSYGSNLIKNQASSVLPSNNWRLTLFSRMVTIRTTSLTL